MRQFVRCDKMMLHIKTNLAFLYKPESFEQPSHDIDDVHEPAHAARVHVAEVVVRQEHLVQLKRTLT